MFNIQIYEAETDIAEAVKNSCVLSHLVDVIPSPPFQVSENLNKLCATERTSFDLYYFKSVLFSSCWNGNDELFLPSEVWHSRNTAKDKPVNYEHTCDDIIGHMTNSYVVDDKTELVADNSEIDKLPELIHVVNQAVLYKCWDKKDKQERIDIILSEIADNKWFVSVECLFPDFDYVLKDKQNNLKIVSRNKSTAFLTKYLRLFNGEGLYDGCQIGRVPRNFIISGKGLVKRPANKHSVILANLIDNKKLNAMNLLSNLSLEKNAVYISKDKEVKKMNEAQYQEEIKNLKTELQKLQSSIANSEVNQVKKELEDTKKASDAKAQEAESLKISIKSLNDKNVELSKNLEDVMKIKADVDKQLSDLQESQKLQARLMLAKDALKLTDEQAKNFVSGLDKLSDEAFKKHVEFQISFVGSKNTELKTTETVVIDTKKAEEVVKETVKSEAGLVVTPVNAKDDWLKLQAKIAETMSNCKKFGNAKFAKEEVK